ncbi:MAG: dTDP-glucose 4,6-dehydratase [Myxococcales bacterium]|nr:dTDP-glucose 4,6-dehydratase [Myxococcales bacterium]
MKGSVLVTGAAGFIGSNLVKHLRGRWPDRKIISFDSLTYAGSLENLADLRSDPMHTFVKGDVADRDAVHAAFKEHQPTSVFHLAAESHVDKSIVSPLEFVRTNVEGTVVLLQEARTAWGDRKDVRFHHVSTDEVFGTLGSEGSFTESTPYAPNSPYSASKASSDHFVRAWHETYGLPIVLTNCSNNYGPFQFPEKLIPVVVTRALAGDPVPVYGKGENIRDWLYVEDHCDALALVHERGIDGGTYCVGGNCEVRNLDLVEKILDALDLETGKSPGTSRSLISFVTDRPGHDFRYAIDTGHIHKELGWSPSVGLEEGLRKTVAWYVAHQDWCDRCRTGEQRKFEKAWYQDR